MSNYSKYKKCGSYSLCSLYIFELNKKLNSLIDLRDIQAFQKYTFWGFKKGQKISFKKIKNKCKNSLIQALFG